MIYKNKGKLILTVTVITLSYDYECACMYMFVSLQGPIFVSIIGMFVSSLSIILGVQYVLKCINRSIFNLLPTFIQLIVENSIDLLVNAFGYQ